MKKKSLMVLAAAALLLAGGVLYVPSGFAHRPWDQFDDTRFAPIERTKREIGLIRVAVGLTSPLKGVVAPGLPNHLFVVDQPGQIWAIDLTATPRPVTCPGPPNCILFHDVSTRLVPLGVLGPNTFDERGLLGLAFHPDFASNGDDRGKFYTYTSEPVNGDPTFPTTLPGGPGTGDHQNVVAEWKANNAGDPAAGVITSSRRELIRVDWPQFNHDGGDLAFGPDDMLFISMGDGGGADDRDGQQFVVADGAPPANTEAIVGHGLDGNGQKLTNPLGKILRIDVDGDNSANGQYGIPADNPFVGAGGGVIEEIFAFGFRNPYRFSFDDKTGDLLAGDVGQNDIEEVDRVVKGGNHGWRIQEGSVCFDPNGNDEGFAFDQDPCPGEPPGLIDPIAQYDNHHEGHSVIGGFVYRGSELKKLKGRYIFGDFSKIFRFPIGPQDYGRLFHLRPGDDDDDNDNGLLRINEFRIVPGNQLNLSLLGWGEDAPGELYPLGNISGLPFPNPDTGEFEGVVLKIVPAPEALDVDDDDDDDRRRRDDDD